MNSKSTIPKALREQVWLRYFGKVYTHKCHVTWCDNQINVFDFHVGHNLPESKGGPTVLENLRPICSRCNLSMGNNYTIDQWNKLGKRNYTFKDFVSDFFLCFGKNGKSQ